MFQELTMFLEFGMSQIQRVHFYQLQKRQQTFFLSQHQTSLLALVVAVLPVLLTLLSYHYAYRTLRQPIIKTLLTPPYVRWLNLYLGGT